MDKELISEIRNKLQTAQTTLELLSDGKDVPSEFIKKALEEIEVIDGLLR